MSELRPSTEAGRAAVEKHSRADDSPWWDHEFLEVVLAIEAEAGAERDRLEAALRTIRDASPQSFDWYQNRARAALRGSEGTPD